VYKPLLKYETLQETLQTTTLYVTATPLSRRCRCRRRSFFLSYSRRGRKKAAELVEPFEANDCR